MRPPDRRLLTFAFLATGLGLAAVIPDTALGADHTDSPAATGEPLADIADFYAWMSDDAMQLNAIITVAPFAGPETAFSEAVQYVVHVGGSASFLTPATSESRVVCQFASPDAIECWLLGTDGAVLDYVTGDPSAAAGITGASGDLRVFAGLRDDPFFFNLEGFGAAVQAVRMAAPSLTFDPAGCPAVDAATSGALVTLLTTDTGGAPATDDLDGASVMALVVQVSRDAVDGGGAILQTWASTHRAE